MFTKLQYSTYLLQNIFEKITYKLILNLLRKNAFIIVYITKIIIFFVIKSIAIKTKHLNKKFKAIMFTKLQYSSDFYKIFLKKLLIK